MGGRRGLSFLRSGGMGMSRRRQSIRRLRLGLDKWNGVLRVRVITFRLYVKGLVISIILSVMQYFSNSNLPVTFVDCYPSMK